MPNATATTIEPATAEVSSAPEGENVTRPGSRAEWRTQVAWGALIAGALCAIAFVAGGGLSLDEMTQTEMGITIGSGIVLAIAAIVAPPQRRNYGIWPVVLLFAFTALTAISVAWSVQPDASWLDAERMLAYSTFFAASVALVRAAPERWSAVLGGVTLAAVVVCGYALLTKVFPDKLDASDVYARLRAPYDYWNAIGLTAAMGAIGCLWLGARRAGNALLSALAYPAMGLMLVTLLLAYSRGATAALGLGALLWLCVVPLRLRGALVLLASGFCAALVVGWDFSRHALSTDNVLLAERVSAGHQLGALLIVMLLALTLIGLALGFLTGRHAPSPSTRRAIGTTLLSLVLIAVIAFVGALAVSHRGLFGTISHSARSLTDPNAPVPANTPGRLTAVGSMRARYWNEALKVFQAHPALGSGAAGYNTARLRYRTKPLKVQQAHGYVVQTLADLGLVGLGLSLALLIAWLAVAGRATHPFNRRWRKWRWRTSPLPYTPERIGMLSMLCIVVVFGVHSFVDWTWYIPGNACVALLCAGWLAGRGPIENSSDASLRRRPLSLRAAGPTRIALAATAILGTLLIAWSQWQPERSASASQEALSTLAHNHSAALADAHTAVSRDPLSAQALLTLSAVQQAADNPSGARATLAHAVHLQPSNPQTWQALGEHDLTHRPHAAVDELRAALYLNPQSVTLQNTYIEALRATMPAATSTKPAGS